MYHSLPFYLFSGAGLVQTIYALSFPFSSSSKDQVSDNTFNFQNVNNVTVAASIYTTELTIAGQKFTVQLDTGSSDLWLDTTGVDLSSFQDTGVDSSITYGDGTSAQGPVLIGNVSVGTFSAGQAFISAPGSNATTFNDKGLLGVGPPLLSVINEDLAGTSFDGSMFLQNVFESDSSLKEFISFSLSRSETSGTTSGGIFTIGELASDLSSVSNSPELSVVSKDRWVVLMDGMIVDGKNVSGNSVFSDLLPAQDSQKTLANLDTGTGLATIPEDYADAIYGSIPGATLDTVSGLYQVPCDAKINVSFVFGGVEYPVHPIDTVQATIGTDGSIVCFSGFLPVDVDPSQDTQDFLLGDSFMRNIYAVFNFGRFISGDSIPTIQLLSTIDADKAYAEFDSLSAQRNASLTGKSISVSTSTSTSGTSSPTDKDSGTTSLRSQRLGGPVLILALAFSGSFIL